jgi:hypothetical protein
MKEKYYEEFIQEKNLEQVREDDSSVKMTMNTAFVVNEKLGESKEVFPLSETQNEPKYSVANFGKYCSFCLAVP